MRVFDYLKPIYWFFVQHVVPAGRKLLTSQIPDGKQSGNAGD